MPAHGYARISTPDQVHDPQLDALAAAGIPAGMVTTEIISGAVPAGRRPRLAALLDRLQPGDSLAVARLDRLGRDPADTLTLIRDLDARGVAIRMLDMGADSTTPAGRLVVAVLAAVAGWERDVLRERTRQGMASARARGTHTGRRHSLTPHQRREAARLAGEGTSLAGIAALLGAPKSVIHRAVQAAKPPAEA